MAARTSGRDQRILIGYNYDPSGERAFVAAVQRQIAATKAQTSTTESLNAALQEGYRIGLSASDVLDVIERDTNALTVAQRESRTEIDKTTGALKEQGTIATTTGDSLQSAGSGVRAAGASSGRQLTTAGSVDRFGRFGTQIAGGLGGGEIGNAVGFIGDITDALGTLGPVGIIATGALVGLTVGISVLNSTTKEAVSFLNAAIAAQSRYYAALGTLTTEQVQARITEIERANELLNQQITEGRAAIDRNIDGFGFGLAQFGSLLGIDTAKSVVTFVDGLDALQAEFDASEQEAVRLQQGLDATTFATNDAAAAEQELTDARLAARQAGANLIAQTLGESREQIEARIQSLREQSADLREAIESGLIRNPDQLAVLQGNLDTLTDQMLTLRYQVLPLADAEVKLKEARSGQILGMTQLEQLSRQQTAANELQVATQKKFIDAFKAAGEARAAVTKAETDYASAQREAESKISALVGQQLQERQDKQDDYGIDSRRQAQDLQDDLVKIQRDAGFELRDAVSNRDALGFTQAKRNRDKALQDAQASATKEQQRARENFNRQLQLADRAAQQRLAQERASSQRELATRAQALTVANTNLFNATKAQLSIYDGGFNAVLIKTQQFTSNLQTLFANAFRLPGIGGGGQPIKLPPGPVGKSLTVNIAGAATKTIQATSRSTTISTLDSLLRASGYQ